MSSSTKEKPAADSCNRVRLPSRREAKKYVRHKSGKAERLLLAIKCPECHYWHVELTAKDITNE